MLGIHIHLYPILTVCLLKILLRGLFGGKALSSKDRNSFPTFDFTLNEKGGLNHVTFFLLVFFLVFLLSGGS